MAKFISINTLKLKATATIKRFALCILFIAALTVALCTMIIAEDFNGVVIFYLSAGALLSLMLKLWQEENIAGKTVRIIEVLCHTALVADAVILYRIPNEDFSQSIIIAQGAIIVAMVLGICFLPFIKEKDDVQSWNFVRRLFFATVIAFLVAAIMSGGIETLLVSANILFNLGFSDKVFMCVGVLFGLSLPLVLILSQIPSGNEKHDDSTRVTPFLLGVTRYLFIPLLIGYIAVSLFYVAKTIAEWELPNGQVSWLVTAMMFGLVIVEFMLYPVLRHEAKAFEKIIARYAPLLILPSIMLMTVGLIRRFGDYGITINRLYMLTLNIWFYIVSLGLFLTNSRRIHWVSLSFGALLLLTSAQPWNFSNITKWKIQNDIQEAIAYNPPKKMPISDSEFYTWLSSFDNEQYADKLLNEVRYMQSNYNRSALNTLLESDTYIYGSALKDVKKEKRSIDISYNYSGNVIIPNGAKSLFMWEKNYETIELSYDPNIKEHLRIAIANPDKAQKDSIIVTCKIAELQKAEADSSQITLQSADGKYTVVPTYVYFSVSSQGGEAYGDTQVMLFKNH